MTREAADGYRRVVPSPEPRTVVETDVIRHLLGAGVVVIAAGGGGIPVVRRDGRLLGIDAVIDKDRTSALLASELDVDLLLLATDVDRIYVNYERADRRPLGHVEPAVLERYLADGQFPAGTMGPKVEAALRFLRAGGREAIVTVSDRLVDAVRGRADTHVTPAGRARPAVEEPTALARSAARYTVIRGARRPVIGSADIDRAGAHVGKVIH
jgi:carbamate kinase